MRKILKGLFTVAVIFILLMSLTGCGENEDVKVENKVNLSIDKSVYLKEERIEVSIDFDKLNKENAVIVITKTSTKHGNEKLVHENNEEYRYLSDFSELPFYMWAPANNGKYDVRVYENNNDGKELASITFEVKEGGDIDTSKKDNDDQDNDKEQCYQIKKEHMSHFQIAEFNIDSSYCIYEYDYRDYVDTIKIFYVADETEQIRAAQYIFDKSGSYESLDDGKRISSIEDAKYFVDNSYRFLNDTYTYTIKLQKEVEEENPFNDLSIKANSIIIEITPRGQ